MEKILPEAASSNEQSEARKDQSDGSIKTDCSFEDTV